MPREVRSRVTYKYSCASRNNACYIGDTSRHISARVRATALQTSPRVLMLAEYSILHCKYIVKLCIVSNVSITHSGIQMGTGNEFLNFNLIKEPITRKIM